MGTVLTKKQRKELRKEYYKDIDPYPDNRLAWCIKKSKELRISYGRFVNQLRI